jgi:hypothetical protein
MTNRNNAVDINHLDVKGIINYIADASVVLPIVIGIILVVGGAVKF